MRNLDHVRMLTDDDIKRNGFMNVGHKTTFELCDELEELRTENAALKAAHRWIPVGERLPKKFAMVLASFSDRLGSQVTAIAWRSNEPIEWQTGSDTGGFTSEPVTHWQPLPPPPKGGV